MGKKEMKKDPTSNLKWFRKGWYKTAEITQNEHGGMDLVLPEYDYENLPPVSIVTITKDRSLFAGVMLYNWNSFTYPHDKLEWVILDDSQDPDENLEQYLPLDDDDRIRYHRLEKWYPVAAKRNLAVEKAKYEFIFHMDDDDYYFPDSILAKIRILLHYKKDGVHSSPLGVYDMMEQSSYILALGKETNDVAEATLMYRKDYWRRHPFKSNDPKGSGEGRAFVGKHFDKWINVHFLFNMISITHAHNVTGHNRRLVNDLRDQKTGDFRDIFPQSFNDLLDNIRAIVHERKQYAQPTIPVDKYGNVLLN